MILCFLLGLIACRRQNGKRFAAGQWRSLLIEVRGPEENLTRKGKHCWRISLMWRKLKRLSAPLSSMRAVLSVDLPVPRSTNVGECFRAKRTCANFVVNYLCFPFFFLLYDTCCLQFGYIFALCSRCLLH